MTTIDQWFDEDGGSHWADDVLPCPYCGSMDNEYMGEIFEEDSHIGSDYKCMDCGSHWTDTRWDELHG